MCSSCGCNVTPGNLHAAQRPDAAGHTAVDVLHGLLAVNDGQAAHNREHFEDHQVFAVNLMSSPGAGKTSLLEATIRALRHEFRIAVIEGDLATENDAARIRAEGVPAVQITTGSACHLDAHMVHDALHDLDLRKLDLVFIENVGNLVCPAGFDLGQHKNVVLLSLPEGDDKPAKYPVMFRQCDLVLISKLDLAPVMPEFDQDRAVSYVQRAGNAAPVHALSARDGTGMDIWLDWLRAYLTPIVATAGAAA